MSRGLYLSSFSRSGARHFIIVFVLSVLAWGGASAFTREVDRGGQIGEYQQRIAAKSGRHVISGDCMSACTLWLGYKGTCVTPDAVSLVPRGKMLYAPRRRVKPVAHH